jgi:hypothetical protein
MDERPARLMNLPTSVKGICFHDNDGEAYVILNARLTREQNRTTYDHEQAHIARGDLWDQNYDEYN